MASIERARQQRPQAADDAGGEGAPVVADELPAPLRPTLDARRLRVALVWGETVVELRDVPEGTAFSFGPRGASLQVTHPLAGGRPVALFSPRGEGGFTVALPDLTGATLRRHGQERSCQALVDAGEARSIDVPHRGATLELGLHDRVTVPFGPVRLVARYTRPEAMGRRTLRDRLDPAFASTLVIALLAAAVVMRMMALADTTSLGFDDDLAKNAQALKTWVSVHAPTPPRVTLPPPSESHGGRQQGAEGKTGPRDLKPRAQVAGGKPAHDAEVVNRSGLIAVLNQMGGVATLFGPAGHDGLGGALDRLGPGSVADAGGLDGAGSRGRGPGGGGHDLLGIGDPFGHGPGGPGGHPLGLDIGGFAGHRGMAPVSQIRLSDNYDRETIARIVRRHFNELRYCYEKALSQDPNLAGKVSLFFQINPLGGTGEVKAAESTLENAEAVACMLASAARWQFPAPRGGGVVDVTYPFIFEAN